MITYKEKLVCFIDILGFGEMIDHNYLDSPETIYSILSKIRMSITDWAEQPITSNIDLHITQFSDCLVFSFLPSHHYFMTFNFFKELSISMIESQVIFRGGITYGKIFHDSELIFGPAMNCAYHLESKKAIFPIIVIDQNALNLRNDDGKTITDYPKQFVFKLVDGDYSYIDYIIDVGGYVEQTKYYDSLRSIISKGLNSEIPSVKSKYEWMKNEYNKAKENYPGLVKL